MKAKDRKRTEEYAVVLHMPFEKLPSPILLRGDEHIAYRDPAAVVADGWLHLFFTLVETEPDGGIYMYLGKTKSRDLLHWPGEAGAATAGCL